jgi:hypothetical protein
MAKHERLLVISNRISDWFCKNYPDALKPGLIEYGGWKEDIFNLRLEEDIFKLFTLAINWNTNISWEIGLATFEVLDEMGFLTVEQLRDTDFVEKTKQKMKSWNFKYLVKQRIRQIQQRPYANPRKIRSGPRRTWVDAYHVAATNWNLIRNWLNIDEILRGGTPQVDGRKLIESLKNLFLINFDGKTRRMLYVKTFLICRELRCQNVINIETKYCCVPDSRVTEQLKTLDFPTSYSYYKNSETLAQYFKKLYDLPVFFFYEECEKQRKKGCKHCIVNDSCYSKP